LGELAGKKRRGEQCGAGICAVRGGWLLAITDLRGKALVKGDATARESLGERHLLKQTVLRHRA